MISKLGLFWIIYSIRWIRRYAGNGSVLYPKKLSAIVSLDSAQQGGWRLVAFLRKNIALRIAGSKLTNILEEVEKYLYYLEDNVLIILRRC
jgi:hypothetical protein